MSKDVQPGALARLRLYNNALIESRAMLGWGQGKAAEKIGVSTTVLGGLERLQASPWCRKGGLRPSAEKVMEFYGLSEEVAFPPALYGLPQIRFETLVSPDQLLQLTEKLEDQLLLPSPEEAMVQTDLEEQARRLLATLTPREEKVLRMRYGIGGDECTLDEVAGEFDMTRERTRQIEGRALRKARGPTRSRMLRDFVK